MAMVFGESSRAVLPTASLSITPSTHSAMRPVVRSRVKATWCHCPSLCPGPLETNVSGSPVPALTNPWPTKLIPQSCTMPGISPSTSPLPRNQRRSFSFPPPISVVLNQKLVVKLSCTGRSISTRSSPASNENALPIRPAAPNPASRTCAAAMVEPGAEFVAVRDLSSSNAKCATSPSVGARSTNALPAASAPTSAPRSMEVISFNNDARLATYAARSTSGST